MAQVRLRAPLSELAGGPRHQVTGDRVLDVLLTLERERPAIAGWVLDERRLIRPHVNVYVNGQPATEQEPVAEDDVVHVLPSITGGA